MGFHWLDGAVVVAYLIAITLFGAHFGKSQHTIHDYFLGGRRLPWWAIAFSVVSAETSILTIISTPGLAFNSDLAFLQLVMGYLVARVVVALVLIPRYFAGEIYTAYQLIERRFGRNLRLVTASLFLATRALAEGVRVFAISIVIEIVLQTGVFTSVVIITALTLFYTYRGGLTAVIWTDVIQFGIYVAGTLLAVWIALSAIPGGWAEVSQIASAADKLAVFHFGWDYDQPYLFWSGLIGGTFLSMASHGTDQLIVQRLLAARSMRDSQKAVIASGGIVFLQFALFLIAGVVLFAFYSLHPPAEPFIRADRVFPTFVVANLPVGIAGLVVAAIIAAAMANLSAALNSLASSTIVDFYKPFFRPHDESDAHYLRVSRLVTLFWGGALIVIALLAQFMHKSVLELALTIASVPYGCMLGIFLLGVWTRRVNGTAAALGALAGLTVLLAVMGLTPVAWTWFVAIGAVGTFAFGCLASLVIRDNVHTESP